MTDNLSSIAAPARADTPVRDARPEGGAFGPLLTRRAESETPGAELAARTSGSATLEAYMEIAPPPAFKVVATGTRVSEGAPARGTSAAAPQIQQAAPQGGATPSPAPAAAVATKPPPPSFGRKVFNFLFGTPFFKVPQLTSALTLIYFGKSFGPAVAREMWHGTKALLHVPEHSLGHDFTKAVDANYPKVLPDGTPAFANGIRIPIAGGAPVPGGTIPTDIVVLVARDGQVRVTDKNGEMLDSHVKHNRIYVKASTPTGAYKDLEVAALDKKNGRLYVTTDKPHEGTITAIPASPEQLLKIGLPVPATPNTVPAATSPTTAAVPANGRQPSVLPERPAAPSSGGVLALFAASLQRENKPYAARLSADDRYSLTLFPDGLGIVQPMNGKSSIEVTMDAAGVMRDGTGVPLFRMGPDLAIVTLPDAEKTIR